MKIDTKDKLKVAVIMIVLTSLVLYSFYIHRNEPHWFETKYVKIVKQKYSQVAKLVDAVHST